MSGSALCSHIRSVPRLAELVFILVSAEPSPPAFVRYDLPAGADRRTRAAHDDAATPSGASDSVVLYAGPDNHASTALTDGVVQAEQFAIQL
jgi:hypothetical protein